MANGEGDVALYANRPRVKLIQVFLGMAQAHTSLLLKMGFAMSS